jgi:hypothetical protein
MSLVFGDPKIQNEGSPHENARRNGCAYVSACWLGAVRVRRLRNLHPNFTRNEFIE